MMRTGALAVLGGVLLAVGAALPWLSLFAGLRPYSGLAGLYGRLVFGGGALAVAGGAAMCVRGEPWLRTAVGTLGVLLAVFIGWLLVGLRATSHALAGQPMLIARPGPGLFVALAGALVVCAVLAPQRARPSAASR